MTVGEDVKSVKDQIMVQSTQPQEPSNKLWIKENAEEEYTVPTYEEFEALSSAINVLDETVDAIKIKPTVSTPADIMTIVDGANNIPVDELIVGIEPVQDLHGYEYPWPGGGSANIWDEQWHNGRYNSSTGYFEPNAAYFSSKKFKVTGGTTYYAKIPGTMTGIRWYWTEDDTFIGQGSLGFNQTFTVPDNAAYMAFGTTTAYGSTYKHDIAINYPATVTTYSPYENICPITGFDSVDIVGTGKNLISGLSNAYFNKNTKTFISSSSWKATPIIKIKPETKYIFSLNGATNTSGEGFYITKNGACDKITPSRNVFTTGSDWEYVVRYWDATATDIDKPQLEEISASETLPTSYEPFGTTYPVTFPSGTGTVYGGTLTVNSDGTGRIRADLESIPIPDTGWWNETIGTVNTFFRQFSGYISPATYAGVATLYCNKYKVGSQSDIANGTATISGRAINTNVMKISIRDDRYATIGDFAASVSDLVVIGKLASPIEITLTAPEITTLLGTNNVWSNAGPINKLTYCADSKMYIDNKITQAVAAALNA